MSMPSAVTRSTPLGTALEDGYQTLYAFALDPDVSFWEKSVTPPGIDNEDPIPVTTMHNVDWRTVASRALNTMTNSTIRVAWTPAVFGQIKAMSAKNQQITLHFPNGVNMSFWGYIKSFQPDEITEGEQPEADLEIVVTNRNPSTGAIEGPWGTAWA